MEEKSEIQMLREEVDRLALLLAETRMRLGTLEKTQLGGAVIQEIAWILLRRVKNLSDGEKNDIRFAKKRMQDGASLRKRLESLVGEIAD
jgi:hypothetical protein